ncbi:protein FAR1-RELATED SEQUENCE 5-like [Chenopodium quinoa]|uniref:protein FAR1-RELATED SEQUENCE 5-like n=1 Tax=Chenopodium quinoa TaxID=63459 RepID=UPI000B79AE75|nr:protein FAR1-RELATED SEQUENCE 5-like [Chenopodium quinoa]
MEKYKCWNSKWLQGIYDLKKKWCPAYSKEYFSGGILSSQRSETTNKSVSHRLSKTDGLCDFYRHFNDVVDEWRNDENGDDFETSNGNRYLAFAEVRLLLHAKEIYTREIGLLFEENYITTNAYKQNILDIRDSVFIYHVWREAKDHIMHVVTFNCKEVKVDCTCKGYSESGILCVHSLRIFLIHCIEKIPDWKVIDLCYENMKKEIEDLLATSKQSGEQEAENNSGSLPNENANLSTSCSDQLLLPTTYDNVKDPTTRREKYVRNDRPKSFVEKKCSQIRSWKYKQVAYIEYTKDKAQLSIQSQYDLPPGGMICHPRNHNQGLEVYVPDNYFNVSFLPPEIL